MCVVRRAPLVLAVLVALTLGASAADVRTWTDTSGKFEIKAEFVETSGANVILKSADGKKMTIPLARLSPKDREFVKALEMAADENPFKPAGENPFKPAGDAPAEGTRHIEVDWSQADEVTTAAGDRWEIAIGEIGPLGFEPKIVGLPKKTDFFEKLTGLVISVPGKRAAVSYLLGRRDNPTTRVVVVDLESGRVLANATIDGNYKVVAMHDDGRQIVTERTVTEGRKFGDAEWFLATIEVQDDKITVTDEWIPYPKDKGERAVKYAAFAGENRLVTCNEAGTVAVWDFEKKAPEFFVRIPRTSIPALSPDRRYLGYCGGNKVGFVDLKTRQPVAMKPADAMTFWVKGQFSPSGERFAASSQQKLMIWDTASGEVLFEGGIPGVPLAYGLEFPAEDFVLVSKEYLFEWTSGIKVWQYNGGGPRECVRGVVFMAADALVPVEMPHPAAAAMLEKAKTQADLFVVKKGTPLAVDVSAVPEPYRKQAEAGLKQQIKKAGCTVAPQAPVTVKATVSGPKKDRVSYFRAGSFDINKYTSTISYVYDGKTIWSTSRNNVPGVLYTPRDKSYQQQIDEAGSKPNIGFFSQATLPEYLQKPTAGNQQATGRQTLGVSNLTAAGVN